MVKGEGGHRNRGHTPRTIKCTHRHTVGAKGGGRAGEQLRFGLEMSLILRAGCSQVTRRKEGILMLPCAEGMTANKMCPFTVLWPRTSTVAWNNVHATGAAALCHSHNSEDVIVEVACCDPTIHINHSVPSTGSLSRSAAGRSASSPQATVKPTRPFTSEIEDNCV